MSAADRTLREESVRQHCRLLRLPTVAAQFGRLADEAIKQQYGPVRYLEALLATELEERERSAIARRIFEAKLPRVKSARGVRLQPSAADLGGPHSPVIRGRLHSKSGTTGLCW
ncbi:MAG: hypothetical protein ACJ746_31285 [Bryobacteraceae bacterium]